MLKFRSGKQKFFQYTLLLSSALLLLFIVWLVFIAEDFRFDDKLHLFIASFASDDATAIMNGITFLGNHQFLIPANLLLIAFFLFQKRNTDALTVTFVAFTSLGLMSLLKRLFHRLRPPDPLVEGITNFSFPSGHAFMSVSFFGILIFFIMSNYKPGWKSVTAVGTLLFIIFLIGISRIYLKVHYATDVLAGWILGSFWLLLMLAIAKKIADKKAIFSK